MSAIDTDLLKQLQPTSNEIDTARDLLAALTAAKDACEKAMLFTIDSTKETKEKCGEVKALMKKVSEEKIKFDTLVATINPPPKLIISKAFNAYKLAENAFIAANRIFTEVERMVVQDKSNVKLSTEITTIEEADDFTQAAISNIETAKINEKHHLEIMAISLKDARAAVLEIAKALSEAEKIKRQREIENLVAAKNITRFWCHRTPCIIKDIQTQTLQAQDAADRTSNCLNKMIPLNNTSLITNDELALLVKLNVTAQEALNQANIAYASSKSEKEITTKLSNEALLSNIVVEVEEKIKQMHVAAGRITICLKEATTAANHAKDAALKAEKIAADIETRMMNEKPVQVSGSNMTVSETSATTKPLTTFFDTKASCNKITATTPTDGTAAANTIPGESATKTTASTQSMP